MSRSGRSERGASPFDVGHDYDERDDVPLKKVDETDETDDKLDMIVVYNNIDMIRSLKKARINQFLRNLGKVGLGVLRVRSLSDPSLVFVKISADDDLVHHYAPGFGIDLHCNNPYFVPETPRNFETIFDLKNHEHVALKKISQSIGSMKVAEITSCERVMVIVKLMSIAKYGVMDDETGIKKLLEAGTFLTMYPVHDPDLSYKMGNPLMMGERMLLMQYWGAWKFFFKVQPIFLIQKYFGAEVGFYYAYMNFYIRMLVPAAIMGLFTILIGVLSLMTTNNFKSPEVCSSKLILCPFCPNFDICPYEKLDKYCILSYFDYILDNQATVLYGIMISIWTTVVVELWKRKKAFLSYQWNVYSALVDVSIRPEYDTRAKMKRLSPVTGEWEPCETAGFVFWHMIISYAAMLVLAGVAGASLFGVMAFYHAIVIVLSDSSIELVKNHTFSVSLFLASVLSVLIMLVLEVVYKKAAQCLVDMENPRTELEYDNSYTYKYAILSCINGFGVAVYIAFGKGRLYISPREAVEFGDFRSEQCNPTGCNDDLSVHIMILLVCRCFIANIYNFCRSFIALKWSRRKIRLVYKGKLPAYEEEYYLGKPDRFFLINKYLQIALQYGYVACFSSSFPITPLIVLIYMLFHARYEAVKFLRMYRRPIPVRVSGLGAWRSILRVMTHIGVITQAFIIGFTLQFIPTEIAYYGSKSNTTGTRKYFATTLSVFDTKDYDKKLLDKYANMTHPATCYYTAKRYPPDHPNKYELSGDYWYELCWALTFIILFQQIVLGITAIIAYSIPDVSEELKSTMEHEHMILFKKNIAEKQK